MEMMTCKKCKSWTNLKLVMPYDKEGIWLSCEKCGNEQKMPDIPKTKIMWAIQVFHNRLLSHMAIVGGIEAKDLHNMKTEALSEIWFDRND
jgi:hypothetical protein